MSSSCCQTFKEEILPYIDCLHSTTVYETKKKTKFSKCGIIFVCLFISTFIILFFIIKEKSKKNPSISFYQDFIRKREFIGKKITLGFNVSDQWKDQVVFTLYNQDNETVNLSICDENLEESKNLTYFCIINYSIQKSSINSYSLKLYLNLTKNITEEGKVPFSISIREPNINHSNEENPLDLYHETSINKFRCFYNTKEITSYRRNLKFINYISYGGYSFSDKNISELYLDDFEDSRKIDKVNGKDDNFLGSYRILLSKKIDIYERKYDGLLTLISNLFSYYGLIMLVFGILIKIFLNPIDNIRIYEELKEKEKEKEKKSSSFTEPGRIYESSEDKETISEQEFKKKLQRSGCKKFCDKFAFIFCHCCKKNEGTKHLYIISDYIDKNLSIENKLLNSVKDVKNKEGVQYRSRQMNYINDEIEE